ncbi:putative 2-aminoethylphosphonate-binding periplasmic protein precursor [Streptomyces sp. ADI96-15]|uniref:hypothetical protein n=1 Tax=Streptomyces sp. ADI96-15 TaxID=1522761 RepID=UPI000F54DFB6|nr:hypothetical protein [Streptomyces sp. ADI96-15]RPK64953.1 putative 2-aminoethylphosphonate-binding periplasmic protein precursor [Streptomyces sp. ADI96-15]
MRLAFPHLRLREEGELLAITGDVQMDVAQPKEIPNLGIRFRPRATARPLTFALPYAAGLVQGAPRSENGKEFSDYFLPERAQKDVEATDANAVAQSRLLKDVEIFTPDWAAVGRKLDRHVGARKSARQLTPAAGLPTAGTGASDPRTWSAEDWASDIVPHLAYGW